MQTTINSPFLKQRVQLQVFYQRYRWKNKRKSKLKLFILRLHQKGFYFPHSLICHFLPDKTVVKLLVAYVPSHLQQVTYHSHSYTFCSNMYIRTMQNPNMQGANCMKHISSSCLRLNMMVINMLESLISSLRILCLLWNQQKAAEYQ